MEKKKLRVLALVLAVAMLLCGCELDFMGYLENLAAMAGYRNATGFADMEYTRPDPDAIDGVLEQSCATFETASDIGEVIGAMNAYFGEYDTYYTNYNLAYIHYCMDVTDPYWQAEYAFCSENSAVLDAGLDTLYRTLAAGSWRTALEAEEYLGEGFFEAYDGESMYTDTLLALMEEEAALESRYFELYEQSLDAEYYSEEFFSVYGTQMAEIFVELVGKRQQIAACIGYESYPAFAYDFYYYRDYTPAEAEAYLQTIGQELRELYILMNGSDVWNDYAAWCAEGETLAYVRSCAGAMGGAVEDAFATMVDKGLYDIKYSESKMDTSFEIFLNDYYAPYVFVSPEQTPMDKLSFAHEFGHLANDYVCGGSYAGQDVAEVHSQGMEYLSLFYAQGGKDLERLKMAGCLCVYVEQAAYALFEQRVYSLTGDKLTVENVQALYTEIGTQFGFDSWGWDCRDYVVIEHFFTMPMYVVSYVVSNDLAFQLYQMERETVGKGLEVYMQCLHSQDSYIMTFADQYGLENPFQPGRITRVRETLEAVLQ